MSGAQRRARQRPASSRAARRRCARQLKRTRAGNLGCACSAARLSSSSSSHHRNLEVSSDARRQRAEISHGALMCHRRRSARSEQYMRRLMADGYKRSLCAAPKPPAVHVARRRILRAAITPARSRRHRPCANNREAVCLPRRPMRARMSRSTIGVGRSACHRLRLLFILCRVPSMAWRAKSWPCQSACGGRDNAH